MIKKFIRGNQERGAEVIKALENLGGVNRAKLYGVRPDCIYIINKNDNCIDRWDDTTDYASLIQECFEEIILEDKKGITNKQFADWYFDQLFSNKIVQYKFNDKDIIRNHMYEYLNDDDPTTVKYIRFNFGEWAPIDKVDII